MDQNDQSVKDVVAERGKVYGDPKQGHTNIGLAWTGIVQQHFGITLDHPIPPEIVALMMCAFKVQRACRVFKADNYLDLRAYLGFAEEFQRPEPPQYNQAMRPMTREELVAEITRLRDERDQWAEEAAHVGMKLANYQLKEMREEPPISDAKSNH